MLAKADLLISSICSMGKQIPSCCRTDGNSKSVELGFFWLFLWCQWVLLWAFLSGWFLGELESFFFHHFFDFFFSPDLCYSIHTFPTPVLPSMVKQTLFL